MTEPKWILEEAVHVIHDKLIAHVGLEGVRDDDLLNSALARPKNLYYYGDPKPDIAAMAAAYAYGIISNHAFFDANKRTAYAVCNLFIEVNGGELVAPQDEEIEMVLSVASHKISEEEFSRWISNHINILPITPKVGLDKSLSFPHTPL